MRARPARRGRQDRRRAKAPRQCPRARARPGDSRSESLAGSNSTGALGGPRRAPARPKHATAPASGDGTRWATWAPTEARPPPVGTARSGPYSHRLSVANTSRPTAGAASNVHGARDCTFEARHPRAPPRHFNDSPRAPPPERAESPRTLSQGRATPANGVSSPLVGLPAMTSTHSTTIARAEEAPAPVTRAPPPMHRLPPPPTRLLGHRRLRRHGRAPRPRLQPVGPQHHHQAQRHRLGQRLRPRHQRRSPRLPRDRRPHPQRHDLPRPRPRDRGGSLGTRSRWDQAAPPPTRPEREHVASRAINATAPPPARPRADAPVRG